MEKILTSNMKKYWKESTTKIENAKKHFDIPLDALESEKRVIRELLDHESEKINVHKNSLIKWKHLLDYEIIVKKNQRGEVEIFKNRFMMEKENVVDAHNLICELIKLINHKKDISKAQWIISNIIDKNINTEMKLLRKYLTELYTEKNDFKQIKLMIHEEETFNSLEAMGNIPKINDIKDIEENANEK